MKKVLFSLLALMAVMTVQAQSICGSWRTVQPVVETEDDGSLIIQNFTYTFNEDGSYLMTDEITLSSEPAPTMAIEIAVSIDVRGAYALDGDILKLTPDEDSYSYTILSISMNGQVADNPLIKSQMKSLFNSAEFKNDFLLGEENPVKVSDSSMEMTKDGTVLNFTRFATIKN